MNGLKKHDPFLCCLQETYLDNKEADRLKVKEWENISYANRKQNEKSSNTSIKQTAF